MRIARGLALLILSLLLTTAVATQPQSTTAAPGGKPAVKAAAPGQATAKPAQKPAAARLGESQACVDCHTSVHPGIVGAVARERARRRGSRLPRLPPGAGGRAPTPSTHNGCTIAMVVTPRDCARCHSRRTASSRPATTPRPATSSRRSTTIWPRPSRARGCRSTRTRPTPGRETRRRRSTAWPASSRAASSATAPRSRSRRRRARRVTVDDLKPGPDGMPTNAAAVARIARDADGRPILRAATLAEHRHRPPEPRRLARLLHRLPQPPRLLAAPRAPARELRQVPPRARTTRRRRSTRSRSTASPTAICATR